MSPYTTELVHTRKRANRGVIVDRDVTRKRGRIRHDDVISQSAVMSDVRVCHYEVVVADSRTAATAFRTPMDIHILSKDVVVADREERLFTLILQVLRRQTDRAERIKLVARSYRCRPLHNDL
jgi:hypothetical protein